MSDSTILKRLGQRIRTLRIEAGLTQEELAFRAGLDRSYVGGVERGERNISLLNLNLIAEALNTTISSLTKI